MNSDVAIRDIVGRRLLVRMIFVPLARLQDVHGHPQCGPFGDHLVDFRIGKIWRRSLLSPPPLAGSSRAPPKQQQVACRLPELINEMIAGQKEPLQFSKGTSGAHEHDEAGRTNMMKPPTRRPEFVSMTLCRFENRVADPLAETASSRFVKQLGYLTLLHQACQTLSIVCVALGIGREVPVRLLLSAGHWAPPFQCRPLFGPTVSPKITFRSSAIRWEAAHPIRQVA